MIVKRDSFLPIGNTYIRVFHITFIT